VSPALTLAQIVAKLGGEAVGEVSVPLTGVATLDSAGPAEIAFLANPKYRGRLATTRAGAVILGPGDRDAGRMPRIVSENPYAYYARTVALFHPERKARAGVHASAQVAAGAKVAASAEVGPFAVIEAGATVGEGAVIGAHCVLGEGASIGAATRLHPRVTIYRGCSLGARCIVHSGAVIGADGFGMAREAGAWLKIPQVGGVRIGDDVEIGANTTIDRGALADTVIEDGVKLDNLIQIAHNVRIGAHTAMAGCSGVAGSTRIGRHCTIGGSSNIIGHIEIVDHVHVSACTYVSSSIRQPGHYSCSFPFDDNARWEKNAATLRQLSKLRERVRALEKKTP